MSIKPLEIAKMVIKENGIVGLYKGLDAAFLR